MFKHNGIMGNYASQHLFNYFISCVKPAYDYFTRKFDFDLKESVFAFKLPCHILIFELNPAASDVDKSKNLNYDAIIGKLKWSIWLRQKTSQQLPLQGWRKQICIGQAKQNVGRRFCSKPENCLSLLNFLFNQYFIVDK